MFNFENTSLHYFQIFNTELETIYSFIAPLWLMLLAKVKIAANKKKAYDQHAISLQEAKEQNLFIIYTDESNINSKVDAAIYSLAATEIRVMHKYLGTDITANVYLAELKAIGMAMEMAINRAAN